MKGDKKSSDTAPAPPPTKKNVKIGSSPTSTKTVADLKTDAKRKEMKKDVTDKGKDDAQVLINCIKNCAYYQSCVGANEGRFREIGQEKQKLSKEKETLYGEQHELCEKIAVLEEKSPDFDMEAFREVSFLKHGLSKKIKDMEMVNKKMAQLTLESDRVKKQIYEGARMYKSFIYKRDELLHKSTKKNVK